MYKSCCLVHADLSEYNLLVHMGHVYAIDVSQSLDSNQSYSLNFLKRDCYNITRFFLKAMNSHNAIQSQPQQGEKLSQVNKIVDMSSICKEDELIQEFYSDGGHIAPLTSQQLFDYVL